MAASYDIVFVGDGYTQAQRGQFLKDAAAISSGLLAFGPYGDSRWLINSHALFVASNQSGADHPNQGVDVDTAFDATYDSFGIAYLVTADNATIMSTVATIVPAFDQLVLIVNDNAYGGSGGEVAIVSTAPESLAILRHEVAHSIGGLADEYDHPNPNATFTDAEPNVATVDHLKPLKWGHWVDDETPIPTPDSAATGPYAPVGAYEGARYLSEDMFRPTFNCLMRSLDMAFCPVCTEVLMLHLAADSTMIRSRSPKLETVDCTPPACPLFEIKVAPLEGVQIRWSRDGAPVGEGPTWQPNSTAAGEYALTAQVTHNTDAVRLDADGAMRETEKWSLIVRPNADASMDSDSHDGQGDVPSEPSPDVLTESSSGCSAGPRTADSGPKFTWVLLCGTLAWLVRRRDGRQIT